MLHEELEKSATLFLCHHTYSSPPRRLLRHPSSRGISRLIHILFNEFTVAIPLMINLKGLCGLFLAATISLYSFAAAIPPELNDSTVAPISKQLIPVALSEDHKPGCDPANPEKKQCFAQICLNVVMSLSTSYERQDPHFGTSKLAFQACACPPANLYTADAVEEAGGFFSPNLDQQIDISPASL